jgi:hypothetical protein
VAGFKNKKLSASEKAQIGWPKISMIKNDQKHVFQNITWTQHTPTSRNVPPQLKRNKASERIEFPNGVYLIESFPTLLACVELDAGT